eukprot:scaffold231162_cov15-Prasinocladus_malaysianus.AAC.1
MTDLTQARHGGSGRVADYTNWQAHDVDGLRGPYLVELVVDNAAGGILDSGAGLTTRRQVGGRLVNGRGGPEVQRLPFDGLVLEDIPGKDNVKPAKGLLRNGSTCEANLVGD